MFKKQYSTDKYEFYRTFTTSSGKVPTPTGDGWLLLEYTEKVGNLNTQFSVYAIFLRARKK